MTLIKIGYPEYLNVKIFLFFCFRVHMDYNRLFSFGFKLKY